MALLLEISGGELGFLFQSLAPVVARFVDISLRLQRMAQVQQRLGEVRPLGERFLVEADRVFHAGPDFCSSRPVL